MISKLTANLHTYFFNQTNVIQRITTAWESTSKEDRTLFNLQLCLRKKETKPLWRIQQEITSETKTLHDSWGRLTTSANNRGSSSNGSIASRRFNSSTSNSFHPNPGMYAPQFPCPLYTVSFSCMFLPPSDCSLFLCLTAKLAESWTCWNQETNMLQYLRATWPLLARMST